MFTVIGEIPNRLLNQPTWIRARDSVNWKLQAVDITMLDGFYKVGPKNTHFLLKKTQ